MNKKLRLGGVECGGTSFALSLALDEVTNVVEFIVIDTHDPESTLRKVAQILVLWKVDTVGVGSFGPVCLNPKSPQYGYITSTPKPHWGNVDLLGGIRKYMIEYITNPSTFTNISSNESMTVNKEDKYPDVPSLTVESVKSLSFGFNTDVNVAALAELRYGNHGNMSSCAYITVGTGIGVGVISNHSLTTNMLHPEAGHVLVRKHKNDVYVGGCPYHGDCLEGLTNNLSIAARTGVDVHELHTLPDNHEVFEFIAYYLAQLCVNLVLISSPQVIVIGGGLAKRTCLFPTIRVLVKEMLNGYIQAEEIEAIDSYIVPSVLNASKNYTAGSIGALLVGLDEYKKHQDSDK